MLPLMVLVNLRLIKHAKKRLLLEEIRIKKKKKIKDIGKRVSAVKEELLRSISVLDINHVLIFNG